MSKRNSKRSGMATIVEYKGSTILDKFTNLVKNGDKTVGDVIGFLSVQNAALMAGMARTNNHPDEELKQEIVEFYDYYMENFYDLTADAINENWPSGPLIFRIAQSVIEEEEEAAYNSYLAGSTDAQKKEMETLADTIWEIRENRELSGIAGDNMLGLFLPRTIYRENLRYLKHRLSMLTTALIMEKGALTVRLTKKTGDEIFGIRVLPIGIWSPVSAQEMLDAHTLAPNGMRLAPEPGVAYTEIQREKF